MSKAKSRDELRPEFDLEALGRGVTGKYLRRATAGTNLVLLDPDVASAFPDAQAVNRALRLLNDVAASNPPAVKAQPARRSRPRPASATSKSKHRSTGRSS